jgi:peptide/nickel transport system permease protein
LDEWIVTSIVDSIQPFPFLILALVIAAILWRGLTFGMISIGMGRGLQSQSGVGVDCQV